jgi:hypothetical protein
MLIARYGTAAKAVLSAGQRGQRINDNNNTAAPDSTRKPIASSLQAVARGQQYVMNG